MQASNTQLKDIKVDSIDRNPENPRIFFRQGELEELLNSIRIYGVQVPVAVYKSGSRYVLIDGERRWRCSKKLGKDTVPALIQDEPDQLNNLLLMFNIHSLREQWDLLTIAMKLPRVIDLLRDELSREPKEREICEKTGLSAGVLRRCKLLIELPEKYKNRILDELQKPKSQQKLSEDFFIEMERSLKTVERSFPGLIKNKNDVRDMLIKKYVNGTINNLIHLRYIAKIARSRNVDVPETVAKKALLSIFNNVGTSIETIFTESFASAYNERDLLTRIENIIDGLSRVEHDELDDELRSRLRNLIEKANQLLDEDNE